MKKISICMSVCALLAACEYSEADRAKFYEMCMQEEIGSTTLKNLAAYCACFNWARSEDIDPENKDIQLSAAYEKCYSEPFEFTPEQKRAFVAECVALFTEEYTIEFCKCATLPQFWVKVEEVKKLGNHQIL